MNSKESDIREIEDDISALDAQFTDTKDEPISVNMNVNANMMSIKQNYNS